MKRTSRIATGSLLLIFGALLAAAQEESPERAAPTLDDAIFIYASLDKEEVYLGESVTLILEYWELQFRGIKVQPHYNRTQPILPDTEGFYVGAPEESNRKATRDGVIYTVTTYRARLFPARAGRLTVGAWAWKGTVRGHTATGARSLTVDLNTEPLTVNVKPLPDPPGTFNGAVGELDIALAFDTRTLTRGEPVTLELTLSGSGNPQAIQAPRIPEEPWYSAGDPVETDLSYSAGAPDTFSKNFQISLMPLGGGEHTFPPLSLTYFSPSEGRYKVVRTAAVPLTIAGGGPADKLVVIGAGDDSGGPDLETMEDGRLPLVSAIDAFQVRRERWNAGYLPIAIPPLLFLAVLVFTPGSRPWRDIFQRKARGDNGDERLAAVAAHPRPFDALNAVARDILAARTGQDVAGMSVPEIRTCVAQVVGDGVPEAIEAVFRDCEAFRYAGKTASIGELVGRARSALARVPARSGRAGRRS